VDHFAPESVDHIGPESVVHIGPESVVQYDRNIQRRVLSPKEVKSVNNSILLII